MTSNLWVKLLAGTLSLLLSLITCTTALSIVVTPLYMSVILGLAQNDMQVPTALLVKQLLIAALAPMIIGMMLRELYEMWVKRWQPVFAFAGSVGLLLAVFAEVKNTPWLSPTHPCL